MNNTLGRFFEGQLSVKWGSVRVRVSLMERLCQVSQVTYRVPAGLITRVNGCYNDGATTYKLNKLFVKSINTVLLRKHHV